MADLHDGHRNRMRQRVLEEGVDNFQEHELLEVLLYPLIPRRDTNETAHKLIDHFGSLAQVLDADPVALSEFLSESAASYISMLPGVYRRYGKAKMLSNTKLNYFKDARDYLFACMSTLNREEVHLLCLNTNGGLIKHVRLQKGIVNQSSIYVREVIDNALKYDASAVVLGHNHPSGNPTPSGADVDITKKLAVAMSIVQIPLYDHVIVGGGKCFSFKFDGDLDDYVRTSYVKIKQGVVTDITI